MPYVNGSDKTQPWALRRGLTTAQLGSAQLVDAAAPSKGAAGDRTEEQLLSNGMARWRQA